MKTLLMSLTLLFALAGCEDRKPPEPITPARPTTTTPAPLTPSPAADGLRDAGGAETMDAGGLLDAGAMDAMMDAGTMDAGR